MRLQVLTGSIVMGWLLAVTTLGQWSSLGYVRSTIGGAYAATSMLSLKLNVLSSVGILRSDIRVAWADPSAKSQSKTKALNSFHSIKPLHAPNLNSRKIFMSDIYQYPFPFPNNSSIEVLSACKSN
jgi:hypothetical protein